MLLKVGATDLVLRMIEAGTVMRDLSLENPIRAIREVSHDMTGQRRVRLANGREACALDIQREYLSKARDFTDRRGADAGAPGGCWTCGSGRWTRSTAATSTTSPARSTG